MSPVRSTLILLVVIAVGRAAEVDSRATRPASATQAAAPGEVHPALVALQRADADFDRACSGTFELARPGRGLLGPDFGKHVEVCRFSTAGGVRALSGETRYEQDPEFRPQGAGDYDAGDYDDDGNLMVWRPVRKTGLSTPESNRMLDVQEMLLLSFAKVM